MTTLDTFLVLKRLTVHNICIEPKKVKASYSVEKRSGESDSFELMYSYENAYFDKGDPTDINLASMMLVQVALNYGLFFESIVLDGLFDSTDQQFIRQMMENTSREILTNKLLVKNEFLKPPYAGLKAEKREKYTQADLQFVNTKFRECRLQLRDEATDLNKYAILSSGGKDSLLTYGLIREIGEPYPVFINESGRHWFTAVNAHRYYKRTEPNTEKPWCNSDRLFTWMLKQLPFIRENFASIRADIYPVRLWTVAVFLFGVLPVVRKKGIANILIGDEYDTTVKGNLNGISHYNGLYDQSKYFDNTMTRYFLKKGWNIYQYSVLRSMSELLIMKTLIKRYPQLQEQQVSCHAAHEVDGRMHPCGKCEKCRRIIGMITALDENPERCGYTRKQIGEGLMALSGKSVKQLGSDASHLYFMLKEKGLLEDNEFTRRSARAHKEILKLRFDEERSNLEDLPKHIRRPLFSILAEHADGAVKRRGRDWIEFELDDTILNETKYRFDG